jgi:hypothetical protein
LPKLAKLKFNISTKVSFEKLAPFINKSGQVVQNNVNELLFEPNMSNENWHIGIYSKVHIIECLYKGRELLLSEKLNTLFNTAKILVMDFFDLRLLMHLVPNIHFPKIDYLFIDFCDISDCNWDIIKHWKWFWTSVVNKRLKKIIFFYLTPSCQLVLDMLPELYPYPLSILMKNSFNPALGSTELTKESILTCNPISIDFLCRFQNLKHLTLKHICIENPEEFILNFLMSRNSKFLRLNILYSNINFENHKFQTILTKLKKGQFKNEPFFFLLKIGMIMRFF